jgi:hypothetical protein
MRSSANTTLASAEVLPDPSVGILPADARIDDDQVNPVGSDVARIQWRLGRDGDPIPLLLKDLPHDLTDRRGAVDDPDV